MNKRGLHPAAWFFLLTLLVAFLSWIGSIYGWEGVQNLLSAEGFRWKLRNVQDGFLAAPPLGALLVLFPGAGLCLHSGLYDAAKRFLFRGRRLSRKEKRSLWLSLAAGMFYGTFCGLLAWGPWGVARSITGSLANSPLADGISYLSSAGIAIVSVVYGFASDYYRTHRDVVNGMAYAFARFPAYWVTLFFVVQFFTSFQYSGLDVFWGISPQVFQTLYGLCCIFPLFAGSSGK